MSERDDEQEWDRDALTELTAALAACQRELAEARKHVHDLTVDVSYARQDHKQAKLRAEAAEAERDNMRDRLLEAEHWRPKAISAAAQGEQGERITLKAERDRLRASLVECRQAVAALFRVLAHESTPQSVTDAWVAEARRSGVVDGFGKRAEDVLSLSPHETP